MIRCSLFHPGRLAVLGLAAWLFVSCAVADNIITGISASATASATVYNNGVPIAQAPTSSQSQQVLSNASVTSLSASASTGTGLVSSSHCRSC